VTLKLKINQAKNNQWKENHVIYLYRLYTNDWRMAIHDIFFYGTTAG
jgi:hypothetical protein